MDSMDVKCVRGHSVRVGATQAVLALNMDLAALMHDRRWKSNRMPMRFGEKVMV
jgi:hypothetical protein